jgi:hypothetical protein
MILKMNETSQFGKATRENKYHPFAEGGFEYYYPMINPYLKVPKVIEDKVNEEFSTQKSKVRDCVALVITNLLKRKVISYIRRRNYYTENHTDVYTNSNMLKTVDLLHESGYCVTRNGSRNIKYKYGIASSLHVTDKLQQNYPAPLSPIELDLNKIPTIVIDNKPIFKYVSKYLLKPIYSHISSSSSHYDTFYAQAYFLNRNYFRKISIDLSRLGIDSDDYLRQVYLTRIFNNNGCGRWYQKGGLSYQQLPKDKRLLILINGDEVCELDYSAMHPNILYAWEEQQCPSNFYELITQELRLPYNDITKFAVKSVALMSINAPSEMKLKMALSNESYETRKANDVKISHGDYDAVEPVINQELKNLNLTFKDILLAFNTAHPTLGKYVFSNASLDLMFDESTIMTSVLVDLEKRKIYGIPVHDSVVFPKQHKKVVRQVMIEKYHHETGFNIIVK